MLGQPQSNVLSELSERRGFVYLARSLPARAAQSVLALKLAGVTGTPVMRRVYPRGAAGRAGARHRRDRRQSAWPDSSTRATRSSPGAQASGAWSAMRSASLCRSANPHQVVPGKSLTLTLDANIQQRVEDVLAAVGRVYEPKDATAIVMDPRTGAVLALANWPQVNANDPSASAQEDMEDRAVGFDYEPGSTFKVVTVSGALAGGPDHAEHAVQRPRPDPGRRKDDPRRHRTPRRDAHRRRRSWRARATSARSRSANSRARTPSTAGCTVSASVHRPGWACRARNRA